MADDKDKFGEDSAWAPPEVGPDETSDEMDIIKSVFSADAEEESAGGGVFSQDLFGGSDQSAPAGADESAQEIEPIMTEPSPPEEAESEPCAATEASASPEDEVEEPADEAPPEKQAAEAGPAEGVKIVTDDDLRALFEASSPGAPRPPESPLPEAAEEMEDEMEGEAEESAPSPEPPAEPEPAEPEEVEEPEFSAPAMAPVAADVEELGFDMDDSSSGQLDEPPPPAETRDEMDEMEEAVPEDEITEVYEEEEPPPPEETSIEETKAEEDDEQGPPADSPSVSDISPDEIVDNLESMAQVGEMTAVAAGKKGELLDKTKDLITRLAPAGDDFMSVAELKKLFENMNVIIEWAKEMNERLEAIEERLSRAEGKED